jgi:homoserine O-succinyltransferase
MPLLLDTPQLGSALELRAPNCLTVGLVNNMPDAAIEATERQFTDMLRAASARAVVRLQLFSMADLPRADNVRRELAERYRDVSELWNTQLDGLIVTGTEPRAASLKDEPYWATLAKIVDWARDNTASTVWSCLAAHAAVLHADGIERHALGDKLFGVFECEAHAAHPLMRDTHVRLRVPHSRYNELPEQALASCGYRVLTRSVIAGADIFAKMDRSFFLFLQGHPEYEAATLLREYRRDVGRFLKGERKRYPEMPQGYFNEQSTVLANDFRKHALEHRGHDLFTRFPLEALEANLDNTWRPSAVAIYENWLEYLSGRKAEGRPSTTPMRRLWRDWPTGRPAAGSAR